jgi:hypothetical protein
LFPKKIGFFYNKPIQGGNGSRKNANDKAFGDDFLPEIPPIYQSIINSTFFDSQLFKPPLSVKSRFIILEWF